MKKLPTLAVVALVQAGLVGLAVSPQLSARLTGEEFELRVAPVDPIDPFRGAYVALDYPDLDRDGAGRGDDGRAADGDRGDVFVTLVQQDGVMVADTWTRQRPDSGPYLACSDRGWDLRCGIESWFLPQDEAASMEAVLRDGAIAEVRIDGRGHAALVDVRAP